MTQTGTTAAQALRTAAERADYQLTISNGWDVQFAGELGALETLIRVLEADGVEAARTEAVEIDRIAKGKIDWDIDTRVNAGRQTAARKALEILAA